MPLSFTSLIAAVIFLILSWRSIKMGLFALIVFIPLYLLRLDLGPLPTNLWEIFVGIMLLFQIIKQPRELWGGFRKFLLPLLWPLLLIGAGLGIGLFVSPDINVTAGIIKSWFIVPVVFYLLLVINLRRDDLVPATLALLLSTLPISIAALDQVATGSFITDDGRASAWFVSANYLSLYIVPITLLSVHLWAKLQMRHRWVLILMWAINLLAVYFSFSFGGWLALLGSVLVGIIWYRFDLFKKWLLPSLLAGLILGAVLYATNERFAMMLNLAEKSSASIRLQVWATALLMIKENLLTGLGAGSFKFNYQEYVLRLFNPPMEYAILHPHNLAFQILISAGVAGLIGFAWLFYSYFKKIGSKNLVTLGLFLAMAAILIHGLVDTPYFKNDLSALFWILFAFNTIQSNGSKKT